MGILPRTAHVRGTILFTDPESTGQDGRYPADAARRRGNPRHSRRPHRQDLPGADDLAVAAAHDRQPDRRGSAHPYATRRKAEQRARTEEMLGLVGFPDPKRAYDMYPFELSGGLRQRAMIAMALICRPALLIADEPTTALDVTIQAQILQLLRDLQPKLNMAMLLITHDLGVVANIADEVVVHLSRRDHGSRDRSSDIFRRPQHPYLKGLMAAVPHFDMKPGERLKALREVPVNVEHLLGMQKPHEAKQAGRAAVGARSRQVLHHAQVRLVRQGQRHAGQGRRRRQLRHQARRMPGPGRRKRLRQDDGQQDPHAGADARCRLGHLQRRRAVRSTC